jgi:hypothetical protein
MMGARVILITIEGKTTKHFTVTHIRTQGRKNPIISDIHAFDLEVHRIRNCCQMIKL